MLKLLLFGEFLSFFLLTFPIPDVLTPVFGKNAKKHDMPAIAGFCGRNGKKIELKNQNSL